MKILKGIILLLVIGFMVIGFSMCIGILNATHQVLP